MNFEPEERHLRSELHLLDFLVGLEGILFSLDVGQQLPLPHAQEHQSFLTEVVVGDQQGPDAGQVRLGQMLAPFVLDGVVAEVQGQEGLEVGPCEVVTAVVFYLIVVYLYGQAYPGISSEGVGASCP